LVHVPGGAPSTSRSDSARVSAHTFGRILAIVFFEDAIEVGSEFLHPAGLIEELFRGNGEEFGFVGGPVGVEKGFPTRLGIPFEAKVFARAGYDPVAEFGAVSQRRSAVGGAVEHIQFVGEFMIDNIVALFRVAAAMQDGVPNEDERALPEGLSDDGVGDFERSERDFKMADFSPGWDDGRWVDDDGKDISVEVVRETQEEQAGLGGDGDADLVGELKAARPFPSLFREKDLDEGVQVRTFCGIEHTVVDDVAPHDLFPFGGEGRFGEFFAAMIREPVEHGDSSRFFSAD
jgi:hypothetical protein